VRLIDALARRLEREEQLREMNSGVLERTLYDAARAGGLRDVRFLLAAGADVNCFKLNDGYPLQAAARGGHVAVMTALLDAGARHVDGALRFAAAGGHVPAAALLLAHGVNIHYENDLALMHAAGRGRLEMVAFLLDNGADMHARNDGALRAARRGAARRGAARQHGHVVALLLQRAHA